MREMGRRLSHDVITSSCPTTSSRLACKMLLRRHRHSVRAVPLAHPSEASEYSSTSMQSVMASSSHGAQNTKTKKRRQLTAAAMRGGGVAAKMRRGGVWGEG